MFLITWLIRRGGTTLEVSPPIKVIRLLFKSIQSLVFILKDNKGQLQNGGSRVSEGKLRVYNTVFGHGLVPGYMRASLSSGTLCIQYISAGLTWLRLLEAYKYCTGKAKIHVNK